MSKTYKKWVEKDTGGKNQDITPGWCLPDTHVSLPDTHVSPQDTHVSPQDTHVSPQGTHGSPPDTHVSPPDTPPRAKCQKTRRKLMIFNEIDVFRSIFNFDKSIRLRISFWMQKKYQKYHSYRFLHPNQRFVFPIFCKKIKKL